MKRNNRFWLLICCPLHTGRQKRSLQSGWDRDSQVKKGGIVGLTGQTGREPGSEKPIVDPLT